LHESFSCCVAVRFANDNDSQLHVKRIVCFFLFFRELIMARRALWH
jgi:hypothetical protein